MTLKVLLPWPEPELWPNRRGHWSTGYKAKKRARIDAQILTLEALQGGSPAAHFSHQGKIAVRITGRKPAERGQDRDNFQAALKASLDGIALALGCDDKRFHPVTDWGADCPPDGAVIVEIGR